MRVIAVTSGKGGVGKSTVTLSVALAMVEAGARVGVLDADLYGPDIPRMLGLTRTERSSHITLAGKPRRIAPVERNGLKVMSAQFLIGEDQAIAWESPLTDLLLNQFLNEVAWGDIDFLLVDLPPGTADIQQRLLHHIKVAGAIVVVTPQDVAHLDAKKVLSMLEGAGVPVLGGIENMSTFGCPSCGAPIDVFPQVQPERSIWHAGVECLGRVPLDPTIAQAFEDGRPEVRAEFRVIAERIGFRATLSDGGHGDAPPAIPTAS
jgi:ATP-binding protein involved in chromosome partitioning